MMLESLADRLHEPGGPHHRAPDKTAARRLATLHAAGRARVPFTTGILVGIGETRIERIDALVAIANAHLEHGHVQEVIVQNFLPKPGTAMRDTPPCDRDEYLWSIAAARLILPPSIHLQAPPNLSDLDELAALLDAGVDDWGGVSPVTVDHVNPERPWPALEMLRTATEAAGHVLAPRLTAHPEYVRDAAKWIDPQLAWTVLVRSDGEGLARDDHWASGGDEAPPQLLGEPLATRVSASGGGAVSGRIREIVEGVRAGQEVDHPEIVTLLQARGADVHAVCELADELRREIAGDEVTFVRNRNINYTNVCTFKCKFCAFSKGPLSLNLRGNPYLLDLEEIQRRVLEAVECGATEVCLQGGIHPDFDGDFYRNVVVAIKEVAPQIHVHGFTALEVTEGARRLGMPLAEYLASLRDAGLATLPGTAAEILDDEVRAVLCPDKVEHRGVARGASHRPFGRSAVERDDHVRLGRAAASRARTTCCELARCSARPAASPSSCRCRSCTWPHRSSCSTRRARARPSVRCSSCTRSAASRTAGSIDNVQASWVKCGVRGARQILQAGANDLGGTLMDENISRAAGAHHGQELDDAQFAAIVEPLGRTLAQRTTLYGRVQTVGRRLRPVDDDGLLARDAAVPVELVRRPNALPV